MLANAPRARLHVDRQEIPIGSDGQQAAGSGQATRARNEVTAWLKASDCSRFDR